MNLNYSIAGALIRLVALHCLLFQCISLPAAERQRGDFLEVKVKRETEAERKARIAEEERFIKEAEAQRQREAEEARTGAEVILRLPKDEAIARIRQEARSRAPASGALLKEILVQGGKKVAESLAIDLTKDGIKEVAKEAKKALDQHLTSVAKENAITAERLAREGILRDREKYRAEMNRIGEWSTRFHVDRQNEILERKFPDKKK